VEQTITPQASVPQHIYLSTYSDDKTAPLEVESRKLALTLPRQPHGR
jgi:hypothetical protein